MAKRLNPVHPGEYLKELLDIRENAQVEGDLEKFARNLSYGYPL